MQRKVFCLGETVFDLIFEQSQPIAAKAGGSVVNTSVSLGRLGLPVSLISEIANDNAGQLIIDFLKRNNINTSFTACYNTGKTPLALAFLDKNKNANYSFYKQWPAERLNIKMPLINQNDILLFGSFFAITPELRPAVMEIIKTARKKKALIIYDPNFRNPHQDQLHKLKQYIIENIQMADIVRGSDEDFKNIFSTHDAIKTYQKISNWCKNLIYTASSRGVFLHTPQLTQQFPAKKITPLSTIGAGDNFNAGMIYALFKNNIAKAEIDSLQLTSWKDIITKGIDFSSEVCLHLDNYISFSYADKYLNKLKK